VVARASNPELANETCHAIGKSKRRANPCVPKTASFSCANQPTMQGRRERSALEKLRWKEAGWSAYYSTSLLTTPGQRKR